MNQQHVQRSKKHVPSLLPNVDLSTKDTGIHQQQKFSS